MKKIVSLLIATILLLPFGVKADTNVLNFKDTLSAENIELADQSYSETKDQITIYMFRRDGCTHCEDFLNYLNSIVEEYGYMFKLRSFEVTTNADNSAVMERVSNYFGDNATGVPYIIIGGKKDQRFEGYKDVWSDKVLNAIKDEYNSEKRFNLFEEMDKADEKKESSKLYLLVIPVVGIVVLFFIIKGAIKG